VGEPIAMTALLFVVWGDAVRSGVRQLAASAGGRVALGAAVVAGGAGLTAAGVRVANAAVRPVSDAGAEPVAAVTRLDRAAPPLALLDQSGQRFALEQLRGRPVLLTFAFGHCETVCPLVVHDVREAARLTPDVNAAIVVVSLDPWRDLPTRLPAIARAWELPDDAHALSGSVAEVQATLDAWAMAIGRDSLTGDITHPVVVHVIDRTGRIAFTAPGGAALLADLLRRL
jgi:cytochrome oxidase Cu insertion factor (SCO1/SenC/PrrC family)